MNDNNCYINNLVTNSKLRLKLQILFRTSDSLSLMGGAHLHLMVWSWVTSQAENQNDSHDLPLPL